MQYFSAFSSSLLLLSYCVWGLFFQGFKESLILSLKKVEFFLPFGFCPPKVGSVVFVSFILGWDLFWVFICLFVFPLMGKAEWGVNPVCWWLGLYFCFVCCLDEASCTVCYWWVSDARSCVQVFSFGWVLSIWYSLGLVLWWSRVLESVIPLQRLRAWSLVRNGDSTSGLLWH